MVAKPRLVGSSSEVVTAGFAEPTGAKAVAAVGNHIATKEPAIKTAESEDEIFFNIKIGNLVTLICKFSFQG
jgi:hypothetical protein